MNNQKPTEELFTVDNEKYVKLNEALSRLKENEDFQTLILNGYFKDKAISSVSMLAAPYTMQTGARKDVLEQLIAISYLEDYFITIENLGAVTPDEDEDGDS